MSNTQTVELLSFDASVTKEETHDGIVGDVTITKEELFDVDFARQIVANKQIAKEDRRILQRYLKGRIQGNRRTVTYKLGKHVKHEGIGRLCAVGGEGLQCIQRDIRGAMTRSYYWDVDMVNAQPTLLVQLCERNGWVCNSIREYVAKREEMLQEVQQSLSVERWEAKQRIVSLFFGSTDVEGMPPFFREYLLPELRNVMASNWGHHCSDTLKWLEKQPNRVSRGLAYILQTEERKCLLAMDNAFAKRGRLFDVYIHDGGLVRKKDGEACLSLSLLREVEEDVKRVTGYQIHLIVKPIETSFVKEDEDDVYLEMKEEFEKTHFKLLSPPAFVRLEGKEVQVLSKSDMLLLYENMKCNGNSFLKRWMEDESMRTIRRLMFAPQKEIPADCFNTFTGFAFEPKEGDFSAFTEVLTLISGKDTRVAEHIEKMMAWTVQRPTEKQGVCIVVFSPEQGAGKDTYFDGIGSLLKGYYVNTADAGNQLFGRFNAELERTLLFKLEELSFTDSKAHCNLFKSLITASEMKYEQKGQPTKVAPNYTTYVATTNNDVSVVLEDTNRRFFMVRAAPDRVGDSDFWNRIHTSLANPDVKSAYLHHLLNINLTNFNPRLFPVTEYQERVKESFIPYHAAMFQTVIQGSPESENMTWTARELYHMMKERAGFPLNETKFGRDMRLYLDANVITRVRKTRGNEYVIKTQTLQNWLVSKKWWNDMF